MPLKETVIYIFKSGFDTVISHELLTFIEKHDKYRKEIEF